MAGLLTLVTLLAGLTTGARRAPGRTSGALYSILRQGPTYPLLGAVYLGLCYRSWRPLQLHLSPAARIIAFTSGSIVYFTGLVLVLWGRIALGNMYFASTTSGAQLFAEHRLVRHGPFALVRHPMYLGLLLSGLGGLLLYQTWTFALVLSHFPALLVRARREEQVLADEFGTEWEDYCCQVSAWYPRLRGQ